MAAKKPTKQAKSSGRPTGRPSLYQPAYDAQARKLALLGATNDDLAHFFNVAPSTVDKWIAEHPDFSGALKEGREQADANVADRLYSRAMGYSHKAVKIFMPANADEPVYADYVERYPPDTAAAIFWLKNRQRDRWRDKQDIEQSGTVRVVMADE